ncbi:MAG TPA: hypothetical protein DEQ14_00245 [Treponema sp.]|nr:hypothetical protein [Treponema sp.]
MQKKLMALSCIFAIILAFHACTLPTSLEIKGTPKASIPVHTDSSLMNDMITDTITGNDFGVEDLNFFNFTGYTDPDTRKNIQAFLLHYKVADIDISSLQEGLDAINEIDFGIDTETLNPPSIDPGSIGDIAIDPISVDVDLEPLFDIIENSIDNGLNTIEIEVPLPIGTGLPNVDIGSLGSTPAITVDSFEEMTLKSGELQIDVTLDGDISGANVTLSNITLISNGTNITGVDSVTKLNSILLTGVTPSRTIVFDFAGKELNNSFQIKIGTYSDLSTGGLREATLKIEPNGAKFFLIQKISGLNIDSDSMQPVPIDTIELPDIPGEFVYAEIGEGTFGFEIEASAFPGFEIKPTLHIQQINSAPDTDNGGREWEGLGDPWEITETVVSLNNRHLNREKISILNTSTVVLSATDGSLDLTDEQLISKKIPLTITPTLSLTRLAKVYVNFDEYQPELDPIPLGDAAEYLNSITFERVGLNLELSNVKISNLKIAVSESHLGLNESVVIEPGIEAASLIKQYGDGEGTIPLKEDGEAIELKFNVTVGPAIGTIIGISDLELGGSDTEIMPFEIEAVEIIYDWTEAAVNIDSLPDMGGSFPAESSDPIDMSALFDTLAGFQFKGIQAGMFIRGPDVLFDLEPQINLEYSGDDVEYEELYADILTKFTGEYVLDTELEEDGNYSGIFPTGGIDISAKLETALNKKLGGLRLKYDVGFPDPLLIKRDMIDSIEDEPLNAEIVIMIPLNLKAGTGGAEIEIPKEYESGEDLFGRGNSGDLSLDWINKINLKIELSESLVDGSSDGKFFLDDNSHPIEIPLSGKTLEMEIGKNDMDYINGKLPYQPKMGLRFPEGAEMSIARNTSIANIEFSADINYKIDFTESKNTAGSK